MTALAAASFGMSAMGAWGQYQQGQEARNMAVRNAEELQIQAKQAMYNAGQEVNTADYKAAHLIARMSAGTAAGGVDEASGSSKLAITESAEQQKLNDMYTRYAGKVQGAALDYKATTTKIEGQEAADAATTGAIGGLVSGGIDAFQLGGGGTSGGFGGTGFGAVK